LLAVNNFVAHDNRNKAIDNAKQLLINTKAAKDAITNKIAAHDVEVQLGKIEDELSQKYGDIIDIYSANNPTYKEMLALKEKDSSVTGMNSLVPGTDETFAQKAKRLSDEANKQMTIEYKTAYYNLMKKYYQNLELGIPLGFTIYPKQSTSAIPTKAEESTSAIPSKAEESTSAIPSKAKGGSLSFRERAELIRMRETLKAL